VSKARLVVISMVLALGAASVRVPVRRAHIYDPASADVPVLRELLCEMSTEERKLPVWQRLDSILQGDWVYDEPIWPARWRWVWGQWNSQWRDFLKRDFLNWPVLVGLHLIILVVGGGLLAASVRRAARRRPGSSSRREGRL
jgi:hypothetical protein